MNSFIKITPFNAANSDLSESVEEYLDDIETAALSWKLSLTPGVKDATDRSKIRLFRQNLERNGDAYHWWYYVLPEGDKKDYGKIVREFKELYGIKASQASSLFAVQNEMLSLAQGKGEHIRDYVHRVEKLSRKIPKEMDSLFAIAFVKGMKNQERRQRVTFDLKDTPDFAFLKGLTVVKFSYQQIGEPDPFRPSQQTQEAVEPSVSLYTTPAISQVHAVSKADVGQVSSGTIPVTPALTQEQFNTFISAYESMAGRVPRQPYILGGSSPNNLRGNSRGNLRVTCFNCGTRGHYADTCTNQPLSAREQQDISDRIRCERDSHRTDYRFAGSQQDVPLTGANNTDMGPRAILPRSSPDARSVGATVTTPVSCVRSCHITSSDLGKACVVAARIPAVGTIFENALAEKRARVEDGDSESLNGRRAQKIVRRSGSTGDSSQLRRSLRPTTNPLAYKRGPEITAAVDNEDEDLEVIALIPTDEVMEDEDNLEEIQVPQSGRFQPVSAPLKKLKEKTETAPINWMKDEVPFTIRDAVNGPNTRLQITLPQLLDCSPRLSRDLAELLRSSIPRPRKKKNTKGSSALEPVSLHSSKQSIGDEVVSEASPGAEDNVGCLYIEAWIGNVKIPEVLVDAGAMLDLISSKLVDRLQLERFPVSGLGMRLADDRLVVLKNYVWLDVVVAGVLARVDAYEVAVSQTYQLLLSRRWLKRVRVVEYHDSRTLFIEGSDRVRRKVPAIPSTGTAVKMESIQPPSFYDIDDEDAEDAVETLLNELDHWQEGGEEESRSGN